MLELINFATSTCSQKVRIVLAEKGLEWTDRRIKSGEQLQPEMLKLNPNGVVPTLVHDGVPIVDSSVICEYLDEVFPQNSTTPPDPMRRAKMRSWMRYIEEVPTCAVRPPSYNRVLVHNFSKLTPEQFRETAEKRPLRKHFYLRMGQGGFPQEDIDAALEDIRNTAARMEQALEQDGGPWILGRQFTLADVGLIPSIDRMADLGYAGLWSDRPRVQEWWARIRERPSYRATYYKGSRFSDLYPDLLNRSAP